MGRKGPELDPTHRAATIKRMASAFAQLLSFVRFGAVFFTAAAIAILPADRCTSCGNESRVGVHQCCQKPIHSACGAHAANKCDCKVQPVDRTNLSRNSQVDIDKFLAALPAVTLSLDGVTHQIGFQLQGHGNLPPPVPHRVLHCSWII